MSRVLFTLVLAIALGSTPSTGQDLSGQLDAPIAPRLQNLGTLHHPVTTNVETAQLFFDQGLRLTYAFNHAEAIRAFREASRLDPHCAMAYWGEALALGPNINDPMPHERELEAYAAIQKAVSLKSRASEREGAYIDALAARYSNREDADRAALDAVYARAMGELARRYPDDPDAVTLYGAAIMEAMPWDYWTVDHQPKPGIADAIAAFESVIASHPDHPGAHHYYIHVVEASQDPDRGVPSADKLGDLMPAAGHLVHMPAHIYVRVGRYADAFEANVRAIAADEDYIAQCQAQGLYPVSYYPHNVHFLWTAATFEGRSEIAVDSARKLADKVPHHVLAEFHALEDFLVTPYYAFVRFGRWGDMLSEPRPADDLVFTRGIWHYARGISFTAIGQLSRATDELSSLEQVSQDPSLEDLIVNLAPADEILAIAAKVLAGELHAKRGHFDEAIRVLEEAVALEDRLPYSEPPPWHQPVRHVLGAVLLEAARPAEAELAYRADLEWNRDNGWSLYGLLQSLRMQGKTAEAAEVQEKFERAWARADVSLTSSRF